MKLPLQGAESLGTQTERDKIPFLMSAYVRGFDLVYKCLWLTIGLSLEQPWESRSRRAGRPGAQNQRPESHPGNPEPSNQHPGDQNHRPGAQNYTQALEPTLRRGRPKLSQKSTQSHVQAPELMPKR
ncbi:hypothetical protein PIB30_102558 [Stylosanthes scabra]|uniref:Uncharacterized protein n=1 Tax=Stylosanthes scabra TaxID=79078 RepID=A0ABU6RYM8_9FABA|nr:hypothetical protein [Stylosanthes scabra]